jgi:predicted transcriptional regulator
MQAKREHRDREAVEVSILDALADRSEEGMTVFELRSHVDVDIDRLETALSDLKQDDLIEVDENGERTVILPHESAIGPEAGPDEPSFLDALKRRLGL